MLPGYGFDECRVDYEARWIYTPVRWQAKPDLFELRGKTVKLHFEIQGAALHAYRYVAPPARWPPVGSRRDAVTQRGRPKGSPL